MAMERICTDETWKATSGEILRSDIYMGEYIDHRLSLKNFSDYDYDDSTWKNASIKNDWTFNRFLDKMRVPITKVKHRLNGKLINSFGNTFIYDFSQNMTGVVSAIINAKSGTKLTFKHGEMLNADGTVYTANLRSAEATDVYICSGEKDECFKPLFTFHGFRYVQIEIEGKAKISNIVGLVIYSDLRATGDFTCSDENVSKLYQNIVWGQRGNFVNVPTDCPQRDERLGWLGDAQIFARSAMFNMDCKEFYEKFIYDICDAQLGNGAISGIAPQVPHRNGNILTMRVSAGWRDALVILIYEHYLMYGDKNIIYKTISNIKRYIEHLEYCLENDFFVKEEFSDWLGVNEETDPYVLNLIYSAYSAHLTYEICKIINDEQADYYLRLFEKIKTRFRKECLFDDFKIKNDTQTVYLLAYAFNLVSVDEVKHNLLRKFHEANDHLTTGFLGVKYILPVLSDIGEIDLAYKILTNKTYPSWCYSVLNGATTIWERWDSFTYENGINNGNTKGTCINVEGMNSFNHYSLGSCCEWMFTHCLGIKPASAGFEKVIIKPIVDFSGKINWAKGFYESKNGRFDVSWRVKYNKAELFVVTPLNVDVEFDFSSYSKFEDVGNNRFILYK